MSDYPRSPHPSQHGGNSNYSSRSYHRQRPYSPNPRSSYPHSGHNQSSRSQHGQNYGSRPHNYPSRPYQTNAHPHQSARRSGNVPSSRPFRSAPAPQMQPHYSNHGQNSRAFNPAPFNPGGQNPSGRRSGNHHSGNYNSGGHRRSGRPSGGQMPVPGVFPYNEAYWWHRNEPRRETQIGEAGTFGDFLKDIGRGILGRKYRESSEKGTRYICTR